MEVVSLKGLNIILNSGLPIKNHMWGHCFSCDPVLWSKNSVILAPFKCMAYEDRGIVTTGSKFFIPQRKHSWCKNLNWADPWKLAGQQEVGLLRSHSPWLRFGDECEIDIAIFCPHPNHPCPSHWIPRSYCSFLGSKHLGSLLALCLMCSYCALWGWMGPFL